MPILVHIGLVMKSKSALLAGENALNIISSIKFVPPMMIPKGLGKCRGENILPPDPFIWSRFCTETSRLLSLTTA